MYSTFEFLGRFLVIMFPDTGKETISWSAVGRCFRKRLLPDHDVGKGTGKLPFLTTSFPGNGKGNDFLVSGQGTLPETDAS